MSHKTEIRMYRTLKSTEGLNFMQSSCKLFYQPDMESDWTELPLSPAGVSGENAWLLEDPTKLDEGRGDVRFSQTFTLSNLDKLFKGSPDIPQVALPGDHLGIAAIWWVDRSQIRGCVPLGDFTMQDLKGHDRRSFTMDHVFGAGVLAGRLEVQYILYMQEPGIRQQPGIASRAGVRLATLDEPVCLQIDGTSSQFPVVSAAKPGEPLWWMEFNMEDPVLDPFTEDYICLVLNEAHPAYAELMKGTGDMYAEVFATALEEMFLYIREEFGDCFRNLDMRSVREGTTAYAVLYMKQTFDLNTDTIGSLHRSIRQMVTRKLKGAAK